MTTLSRKIATFAAALAIIGAALPLASNMAEARGHGGGHGGGHGKSHGGGRGGHHGIVKSGKAGDRVGHHVPGKASKPGKPGKPDHKGDKHRPHDHVGHSHHHRHRHHHQHARFRTWSIPGGTVYTGGGSTASEPNCEYLRLKALYTNSDTWWSRYNACIGEEAGEPEETKAGQGGGRQAQGPSEPEEEDLAEPGLARKGAPQRTVTAPAPVRYQAVPRTSGDDAAGVAD